MRRFLLDINVILDLILNRSPWASDAAAIWAAHTQSRVDVFLAAFSLPTILYIVRRQAGLSPARAAVRDCLATLLIVPVDRRTLELAQGLPNADYEDNVQMAYAILANLDAIVTRNPSGFAGAPIPVLAPADVVASLPASGTP